jgi:hypothetical protein
MISSITQSGFLRERNMMSVVTISVAIFVGGNAVFC